MFRQSRRQQGHTAHITSIAFSPLVRGSARWLASTSRDGSVCFWKFFPAAPEDGEKETEQKAEKHREARFHTRPFKFIERSNTSAHQLCCSFSPGGFFLATGILACYCGVNFKYSMNCTDM